MKVIVLFGGQSEEHVISCLSAATVLHNLNREKYEVTVVGITKEGHWRLVEDEASVTNGGWENGRIKAQLLPDAADHALCLFGEDGRYEKRPVDVVIPALHGRFGEDGTIQGLLELARIPYVGCGVAASAVCMDKLYTKVLVRDLGIEQAKYIALTKAELAEPEKAAAKVEAALPYPVFVKPCDGGSSQGVSRVDERAGLEAALKLAARYGTRVMVEEAIFGRELECAVRSTPEGPLASGVGEILAAAEFYSFDAKYTNPDSQTPVDPVLPDGKREEIRQAAEAIFRAVGARGLARVDFFLENKTNRVVFNEVNTFPGFTSISMYPKLWEAAGLPIGALLDELIADAFRR